MVLASRATSASSYSGGRLPSDLERPQSGLSSVGVKVCGPHLSYLAPARLPIPCESRTND